MTQVLVHFSPSQAYLERTLIKVLEEVHALTKENLSRDLRDIQQEAGLRLVNKEKMQGCPQEVLLLSSEALDQLVGDTPDVFYHTQANHPHLSPKALSQVARLAQHFAHDAEKIASKLEELLEATRETPEEPLLDGFLEDKFRGMLTSHDEIEGDAVVDVLAVYKARATSQQTSNQMTPNEVASIINSAQPHIEYYALKILNCAKTNGVSLKSLTWEVRIHELSHLITHLGLDCADHHWADFYTLTSFDMSKYSRKDFIEGSAQELTHRLLERRVRDGQRGRKSRHLAQDLLTLSCFERRVHHLSQPYKIHLHWRSQVSCREATRSIWNEMRGVSYKHMYFTFETV